MIAFYGFIHTIVILHTVRIWKNLVSQNNNRNKTKRQKHDVSLKFDFFKGNFIIRSSLRIFPKMVQSTHDTFSTGEKNPSCVSEVAYLPE